MATKIQIIRTAKPMQAMATASDHLVYDGYGRIEMTPSSGLLAVA